MASSLINVCRFNPTTGGTGDWVYSSNITGYLAPSAAGAVNGEVYSYRAETADLSQWEIGFGAYNSGTGTFARSTVLTGSSGGSTKVNFSQVPQVAIVALADDLLPLAKVQPTTGSLSGNVALNNTGSFFTGPSITQGTVGTWFVSGKVTLRDTAGAAGFLGRLWDGSTVIDSGRTDSSAANFYTTISLSGYITNPAGNLRISVRDLSSVSGFIIADVSGDAKDSTITAFRIK